MVIDEQIKGTEATEMDFTFAIGQDQRNEPVDAFRIKRFVTEAKQRISEFLFDGLFVIGKRGDEDDLHLGIDFD